MSDEEQEDRTRGSQRIRLRHFDEAALQSVLELIPRLPEPLAIAALEVDLANDDGDATGVRKRLFDLGVAVVRYAFAIGLAALREFHPELAAPRPVADAIHKAHRLTDGRWCELVRVLRAALPKSSPVHQALSFVTTPAMNDLVTARNDFTHGGGTGDDAPVLANKVLRAASTLLAWPLHVVASLEPPQVEARIGVPKRARTWKRTAATLTADVVQGEAYVDIDGGRLRVTPWLPEAEGMLHLPDCPVGVGESWRFIDQDTGERATHAALDAAIRAYCGENAAMPRPPVDRPQLVARAPAVAVIQRAMREAAEGNVRVVMLVSPQGGGASRLLREAKDAAPAFGLRATLDVFGSQDRRGPLAGLRLAVSTNEDPALEKISLALELVRGGEAANGRARIDAAVEAVEEAVIEASREGGLLLVVDDAQWLDEQTLALVRLLVERATRGVRGKVALVMSCRAEAIADREVSRLIAMIDRDVGAGGTRLSLPSLSDEEAARLVRGVVAIEPELERHIVREARGLPFYLVQPILVWIESGLLEWRDAAWRSPAEASDPSDSVLQRPVPGIAELLIERLDGMFEQGSEAATLGEQLLFCAAVDAPAIKTSRLEAVAIELGHTATLADRILRSLVRAQLLEPFGQGRVRVAQPMIAHAIAGVKMETPWRAPAVRALVTVMERAAEADRDPATLASLCEELDDAERTRHWYRVAIESRLQLGAFVDARALAERMVGLELDPVHRGAAELLHVESILRAGDVREAQLRLKDLALAVGSPEELHRRVLAAEVGLSRGGSTIDSLEDLVRDADALPDHALAVEARLLLARKVRGEVGRSLAREVVERSSTFERMRRADASYRAYALDLELAYEASPVDLEGATKAAELARSAALEAGSAWAALDVANDAAILRADSGDLDGAISALEEVARDAATHCFGSLRRKSVVNAATLELRAERPDRSIERARRAIDEARAAGDAHVLATALSVLGDASLRTGALEAARAALDESISLKRRSGDPNLPVALLRRADALLLLGAKAAAHADAEEASAIAVESRNRSHVAFAKLWIAVENARDGTDLAISALRAVVAEAESDRANLRAGALRKFAEAKRLLAGGRD